MSRRYAGQLRDQPVRWSPGVTSVNRSDGISNAGRGRFGMGDLGDYPKPAPMPGQRDPSTGYKPGDSFGSGAGSAASRAGYTLTPFLTDGGMLVSGKGLVTSAVASGAETPQGTPASAGGPSLVSQIPWWGWAVGALLVVAVKWPKKIGLE